MQHFISILENLKNDPSEFVRRSVANNLNDIAKDHPEIVLAIARRWKDVCAETDWIIKHGCRTLLKKAHPESLALFGLSDSLNCSINDLKLSSHPVKKGDYLEFSFQLVNAEAIPHKLGIEYAIYYMKANGKRSKKLFKITENTYLNNLVYNFSRKQSFKDMTTRKHYPGNHKLTVVVNGNELAEHEFLVE